MNYRKKDIIKFSNCTQLIAVGVVGSSTYKYEKEGIGSIPSSRVNTGIYSPFSIVGISVNGAVKDRVAIVDSERLRDLIRKACYANAVIVTDNSYHRNRPYNIGERELYDYLESRGYIQAEHIGLRSIWRPTAEVELRNNTRGLRTRNEVNNLLAKRSL